MVLSHNTAPDPMLTYGNRAALERFAPTLGKDDYAGGRIARTGRRFRIERATVGTLSDQVGRRGGQAATFRAWRYLTDAEPARPR